MCFNSVFLYFCSTWIKIWALTCLFTYLAISSDNPRTERLQCGIVGDIPYLVLYRLSVGCSSFKDLLHPSPGNLFDTTRCCAHNYVSVYFFWDFYVLEVNCAHQSQNFLYKHSSLFSNNRGIQLCVLFERSCYRTVGSIGSLFVLFILFFCACFCSRPVQTKLVPINGGPDMPGFAELVPCHVSRVPACPMGAVCDVFTSMPWLTLCKVRSSFSFFPG